MSERTDAIQAALELGLEEVPVIVADDLTPEQARAYRLADNKAGEESEWILTMLEEELDAIEDIDMSAFGFDLADEDMDGDGDGEEVEHMMLTDRFLVPPFTVFDTKQGYWRDRDSLWREMIRDNAEARSDAKVFDMRGGWGDGFSAVSLLNPTLSEVVVRWFRPLEGTACFDPFAGDTVFGFVSSYLGMDFTGIELRQEQVDFNQARVDAHGLRARYICDDGQNVARHLAPKSQDLLFSCPPYYDLERYSDLPNDASNQPTYSGFLDILRNAFRAAIGCLKDDRFAVIVVGDIRDGKGAYRDFLGDVKRIFMGEGLALYNEIILLNVPGTVPFRAARAMRSRKVTKIHQNVLVFYKGDNMGRIKDEFGPVEVMEIEGDDE